jgi:hypothetical protein
MAALVVALVTPTLMVTVLVLLVKGIGAEKQLPPPIMRAGAVAVQVQLVLLQLLE